MRSPANGQSIKYPHPRYDEQFKNKDVFMLFIISKNTAFSQPSNVLRRYIDENNNITSQSVHQESTKDVLDYCQEKMQKYPELKVAILDNVPSPVKFVVLYAEKGMLKEEPMYLRDTDDSYVKDPGKDKVFSLKSNSLKPQNTMFTKKIVATESRLPTDGSDPEFGVPQQEKYPLFDKQHVISAIKLFGHVEPKYESQLAYAIIKRMKKYGISEDMVGEDNKLYKYLHK